MARRVLGLDLGPNSIGWAVLTLDEEGEPCGIVDAGVRVFPEGVDRDTQGREKSKNEQRRLARGARRGRWRRSRRKAKLGAMLREHGLLPEGADELKGLLRTEPYSLRAKGLDEALTRFELGRVLFHLNQRRGFLSNRKEQGAKKERGVVDESTAALEKAIEDVGCRTLGEYFHRIGSEGRERIRGRYTLRKMYAEEFEKLWQKQREFHGDVLTEELKRKLKDETIFYQRPLKPADHLIGKCECERDEARCPRGNWLSQQFRILKEVNNLEIRRSDGSNDRLTEDQREKVAEALGRVKEMTFDKIRKLLGLLESETFNLEESALGRKGAKRSKLKGNTIEAALVKAFGKRWDHLDEEDREQKREGVFEVESPEAFRAMVEGDWELDEKGVAGLMGVDLPSGYGAYSRKALEKMLPHLMEGKNEWEAKAACGYDRAEALATYDRLPRPEKDDGKGWVTNPIVVQALYEVRKVVNAIIREYGKPDRIVVEMAREMKRSAAEREEMILRIRDNEREREASRNRLREEFGVGNPSGTDILALRLWEQQGHLCPYTGRCISDTPLRAHFQGKGELDIDHILPYSRSLDDSQNNKVLCFASANREKGNQTPREWLEGKPEYERMLQCVESMRGSGMAYGKRRRFSQKEVELDQFIARQLTDTAYISREVRRYLEYLYSGDRVEREKHVWTTRGQVTADLRWQWGLDGILNPQGDGKKLRDDHRHHAVDAMVVGMTTRKRLHGLSQTRGPAKVSFEHPWVNFWDDVKGVIEGIHVSHRVSRGVAGALHEETNYGPTGRPDTFAYRVDVKALTGAMVEKIRDATIREIVRQRCVEKGFDPAEVGSKKFPAEVFAEELRMPSGVPIKRVRVETTMKPGTYEFFNNPDGKEKYRAVKLGSNHHIEILEITEGNDKGKYAGVVVSTFEAAQRTRRREPIVNRNDRNGMRFVISLSKGESVVLKDAGGDHLCVLQKMSGTREPSSRMDLSFRLHTDAREVSKSKPHSRITSLKTLAFQKMSVDPLGRIHRAND